jgi:hypothetical protein
MARQFSGPVEQVDLVLVDRQIVSNLEQFLSSCERCNPAARVSVDRILDEIMKCDPLRTAYMLEHTATCPKCGAKVHEQTLVGLR